MQHSGHIALVVEEVYINSVNVLGADTQRCMCVAFAESWSSCQLVAKAYFIHVFVAEFLNTNSHVSHYTMPYQNSVYAIQVTHCLQWHKCVALIGTVVENRCIAVVALTYKVAAAKSLQ